ncbi:hypothetical protein HETIRDRAFT_106981 [Heterobasidion irregulare TC 32-1]|uniref:Uncharacterized protein n=1 Tax=Heterobasidion irregulare (strain TC 32-1) TaxID=747525 RepID=W4KAQ4_HETIT|nr:uncharacterized protein HETIRDRAFT_106981 [Heterobasidion irregulare TC 32-1]ETW82799.1 hypothetical protein HETIRDRAFT_106981 [Heterobasidion irregulare TC 32-1]
MHELHLSAISFTRRKSSSSPSMPTLPLPVHSLSQPSPRESSTQAAPTHGPHKKPKPRGFDAAGARASLIPDRELQSPRRACACSQSASVARDSHYLSPVFASAHLVDGRARESRSHCGTWEATDETGARGFLERRSAHSTSDCILRTDKVLRLGFAGSSLNASTLKRRTSSPPRSSAMTQARLCASSSTPVLQPMSALLPTLRMDESSCLRICTSTAPADRRPISRLGFWEGVGQAYTHARPRIWVTAALNLRGSRVFAAASTSDAGAGLVDHNSVKRPSNLPLSSSDASDFESSLAPRELHRTAADRVVSLTSTYYLPSLSPSHLREPPSEPEHATRDLHEALPFAFPFPSLAAMTHACICLRTRHTRTPAFPEWDGRRTRGNGVSSSSSSFLFLPPPSISLSIFFFAPLSPSRPLPLSLRAS